MAFLAKKKNREYDGMTYCFYIIIGNWNITKEMYIYYLYDGIIGCITQLIGNFQIDTLTRLLN